MKKLYPKKIFDYQKKEQLSFIFVLAMFYITVFNTSCSFNLDETESSIIENVTLDYELEDSVLSYIKNISSIKYKSNYIDSLVKEKKISKDSAYMEYLYFKYSYLIKNFYNKEKYDTIDLPLYFTEHEYYETNYSKADYGEVIINGSYVNFANECIRMIQGNVVSCPPYVNGDQCRRIMMNYAFETIRWLDVSTNLFVEALYRESDHFTQYVSGLYIRPDNGPIKAKLLEERINLLLQSTSRLHPQFCPNPNPNPGGDSGGGSNGGGSGGSGGGGTTYPPTEPDPNPVPQPECDHVMCSKCILPINLDGDNTRSIPSCSHLESCKCWWGMGHNKLMKDGLPDLTPEQLDSVKLGSKEADHGDFQNVEFSHYHAMIPKGSTLEQTIIEMRKHFIIKVTAFHVGSYKSLGFALHMIQDAYSPAHSLRDWDGKTTAYFPHIFEGRLFNRPEFNDALEATKYMYQQVKNCESNDEAIGRIFDNWMSDYERQFVK